MNQYKPMMSPDLPELNDLNAVVDANKEIYLWSKELSGLLSSNGKTVLCKGVVIGEVTHDSNISNQYGHIYRVKLEGCVIRSNIRKSLTVLITYKDVDFYGYLESPNVMKLTKKSPKQTNIVQLDPSRLSKLKSIFREMCELNDDSVDVIEKMVKQLNQNKLS